MSLINHPDEEKGMECSKDIDLTQKSALTEDFGT
jgi:hypothetical protein